MRITSNLFQRVGTSMTNHRGSEVPEESKSPSVERLNIESFLRRKAKHQGTDVTEESQESLPKREHSR